MRSKYDRLMSFLIGLVVFLLVVLSCTMMILSIYVLLGD
jgi:hypothetical protein